MIHAYLRCSANRTFAVHKAMGQLGELLSLYLAAKIAGKGHHTSGGAGRSSGNLLGITVFTGIPIRPPCIK
jgi:hypothetical protein